MHYAQAVALHAQGPHVISTDEKTGIQAREVAHPTRPTRPSLVERREMEYIRHGTQCLIANFEVATGQVLAPTIGATRTEDDFVAHIAQTIATDPDAGWIVVVDQPGAPWVTHQSESLVRLVADECHLSQDLGVTGTEGVRASMATRAAFLQDATHRIRFVYPPKHTSWMNQVEIWFSILVRRVLRRGSFASVNDLRERILAFIGYFNRTMAKPFKWTYSGRPLTV